MGGGFVIWGEGSYLHVNHSRSFLGVFLEIRNNRISRGTIARKYLEEIENQTKSGHMDRLQPVPFLSRTCFGSGVGCSVVVIINLHIETTAESYQETFWGLG